MVLKFHFSLVISSSLQVISCRFGRRKFSGRRICIWNERPLSSLNWRNLDDCSAFCIQHQKTVCCGVLRESRTRPELWHMIFYMYLLLAAVRDVFTGSLLVVLPLHIRLIRMALLVSNLHCVFMLQWIQSFTAEELLKINFFFSVMNYCIDNAL